MKNDKKSKSGIKNLVNALRWEEGRTYADLTKAFKAWVMIQIIVFIGLFIVTLLSIGTALFAVSKQAQIAVLQDDSGVFHKIKISPYLRANQEMSKDFVKNFTNDLMGADVHMQEKHIKSLNKMTDTFRKIFMANRDVSGFLSEREKKYENGNTISNIEIEAIDFSPNSSFSLSGRIGIKILATITYEPLQKPTSFEFKTYKDFFYGEYQLVVMPLTENYYEGFVMDYFFPKKFNTEQEREAFLIENKIDIVK